MPSVPHPPKKLLYERGRRERKGCKVGQFCKRIDSCGSFSRCPKPWVSDQLPFGRNPLLTSKIAVVKREGQIDGSIGLLSVFQNRDQSAADRKP